MEVSVPDRLSWRLVTFIRPRLILNPLAYHFVEDVVLSATVACLADSALEQLTASDQARPFFFVFQSQAHVFKVRR